MKVLIGVKSGTYESQGTTTTEMTRDANGLWTVTLGPFEPNLYEYQFDVEGLKIADPGNDMPKPQRHVNTSLLLIPGTPPDFLDVQNGAYGTMRDETYYSTTLGKNRRLLVYTPPSYDRSRAPLPVLYLYHGFTFCPFSPLWVLSDECKNALKNSNKINENLRLFEIVTGDNDHMSGPTTIEFESHLRELNIQHIYTVLPGTHSMFVWRPALANFLQEIFKH